VIFSTSLPNTLRSQSDWIHRYPMRTVRQENLDKAASQTRLVLIGVTTITVLKKIYQPLSKITVNHVYLAS
jgi:CHASE2 domain-containing sensor protein